MPWMFVTGSGQRARRSTRRRRRSRNSGNGYNQYGQAYTPPNPYMEDQDDWTDDDYEAGDDDSPRGMRRRDNGETQDGDWDGRMYDADGNRINLVIQTPSDMLPPIRQSAALGQRVIRNTRTRF